MCQIIWPRFKYLGVHYICQLTLAGNTSALTPPLPRSCCSPTLISAFRFPCFFYSWFLLVWRKAQFCSAEPKIRAGICSWWEDKAPLKKFLAIGSWDLLGYYFVSLLLCCCCCGFFPENNNFIFYKHLANLETSACPSRNPWTCRAQLGEVYNRNRGEI